MSRTRKKGFTALLVTLLALSLAPEVARAKSAEASQFDANIFVDLAKRTVPSVVNISTLTTVQSPFLQGTPDDLFRKFFEDFFGRQFTPPGEGGEGAPEPAPKHLPKAVSLGSGFIIDSSGIILTNNHVVAGADEIKIQFTEAPGETPTDGKVVGRDPELDVALIQVKSKREMTPLPLGNSDSLEVGEYVLAVGNPFGQGHSATHGIISAKGRVIPESPIANYLQTDAPINPGNSGGPLVNLKGEVIGINTAIEARAQGIGFAIPISLVSAILPQLKTKGTVTRGYLGILVGPLSPDVAEKLGAKKDVQAPFVTQVYPGSPAEKAGIQPYDVVLSFNGKEIHSPNELIGAVTAISVGQTAKIKVLRNGKELELPVVIAARPAGPQRPGMPSPSPKKKKERPHVDTGMSLEDLTPDLRRELGLKGSFAGVLVTDTNPGSPADEAGLSRGDIIIEVDRKPVKSVTEFYSIVSGKKSYLLRVRHPSPQPGQEVYSVVVLSLK